MDNFDAFRQAVLELKHVEGLLPLDVLDMPEPLAGIMRRLIRSGSMNLSEFAQTLNLDPAEALQIGELLVERGYLTAESPKPGTRDLLAYRIYVARMRKRNISLDL